MGSDPKDFASQEVFLCCNFNGGFSRRSLRCLLRWQFEPWQPPRVSAHSMRRSLPWKDQGVLNLANSPYAKLHTVPVRAVTIDEGFWSKRRKTNVESSIPSMLINSSNTAAWITIAASSAKARNRKKDPSIPTPICTSGPKPWAGRCSQAISRVAQEDGGDDPGNRRHPGARRIPQHIFPGRTQTPTHAAAHAGSRPRTLQPGTHAARRNRLLPRHRRHTLMNAGVKFVDGFPDSELRPRPESKTDYFRTSGN